MRRESDRRDVDRALEARTWRERARAVEREGAVRLVEDLSTLGPGHEGLMALVVRWLGAEGILDGPTLMGLCARAMRTMGIEAANRVFLGEGVMDADAEAAIRARTGGDEGRTDEAANQARDMAERVGLDPADVEVRLDEEGTRRARVAGAVGVEHGKVIYLDERRFDPETREGREVLGHEVAHVAQVVRGRVAAGPEAAEIEAARVGEALADGEVVEPPKVALEPRAMAAHQSKTKKVQGPGKEDAIPWSQVTQQGRRKGVREGWREERDRILTRGAEIHEDIRGKVEAKGYHQSTAPIRFQQRLRKTLLNHDDVAEEVANAGTGTRNRTTEQKKDIPHGITPSYERGEGGRKVKEKFEMHHKEPVSEAPERMSDEENLVLLTKEEHDEVHRKPKERTSPNRGQSVVGAIGSSAGSCEALEGLMERAGQVGAGTERLDSGEVQEVREVEQAAQVQARRAKTHQPAEAKVGEARAAVEVPREEVIGVEKGHLAGEIVDNPPPDAEIEKLCEKLRSEIGKRRPKDKDDFEKTDPQAMAQAAGDVVAGDVGAEVRGTEEGYERVNEPVRGGEPRPATPISPPEAAPPAQELGAAEAAPKPLKEDEVSLEAERKDADQVWRDAQMETPEARMIQEGPIAQAREAKEGFDRFAAERPKQALLTDAEIRKRATESLMQAERDAIARMEGARQGGLQAVSERQEALRKGERLTREQVAARMQGIFEGARARVNAKLQGMAPAAMQQWQAGIRPLTENFRAHIDQVRRQIEERHEGIGGVFVGLWDKVVGLPSEITREYDSAERDFVNGACDLARSISSWVRGVTDECKQIIAGARKQIDDYVAQLPQDLRKAAEEEKARIDGQFQELEGTVEAARSDFTKQLARSLQDSTDEVRDELDRLRDEAKGLLGKFKDFVSEFIQDPLKAIVDGLLKILGIDPSRFWGIVGRAWAAIKKSASDIVGFAGRVLNAVTMGFKQFGANIWSHLQEGFLNWLFNKAGEAGIQVPKEFSLKGIFNLILQVLGLGWQWIRGRLARLLGEKNVELIEKAWRLVQTFVQRGVEGLVEWVREKLDFKTLVNTVIDAIKSFIIQNVVTRAIMWVVSLFNPASALLKAIELIYRVVTWIMDNASRIFALVEAVVNSVTDIASGNLSKAANWIERSLANFIPMVLDFLAKLLGLSTKEAGSERSTR